MNNITEYKKARQADNDIFNWVTRDMIPSILKKLSFSNKIQQRDYLSRTITNLYEGATRDTMEQKIISLALDWYLERKDSLNRNYKEERVLCAQLKQYYSISFLNWIYDQQKKVKIELYDLELANEIPAVIELEETIIKMNKETMYLTIANYITKEATISERFIYDTLLGLQEIQWTDSTKNTTANYPGGMVSMKTYYNHRTNLMNKLKEITTTIITTK